MTCRESLIPAHWCQHRKVHNYALVTRHGRWDIPETSAPPAKFSEIPGGTKASGPTKSVWPTCDPIVSLSGLRPQTSVVPSGTARFDGKHRSNRTIVHSSWYPPSVFLHTLMVLSLEAVAILSSPHWLTPRTFVFPGHGQLLPIFFARTKRHVLLILSSRTSSSCPRISCRSWNVVSCDVMVVHTDPGLRAPLKGTRSVETRFSPEKKAIDLFRSSGSSRSDRRNRPKESFGLFQQVQLRLDPGHPILVHVQQTRWIRE